MANSETLIQTTGTLERMNSIVGPAESDWSHEPGHEGQPHQRPVDPKREGYRMATHLERPSRRSDGEARHDNDIAKSAESLELQDKPPTAPTVCRTFALSITAASLQQLGGFSDRFCLVAKGLTDGRLLYPARWWAHPGAPRVHGRVPLSAGHFVAQLVGQITV